MDQEDYWSSLPRDVACVLIQDNITDVHDILNLRQSSKTFKGYSEFCVRHISSKKLILVKIEAISQLINLETIGEKIYVMMFPRHLSVIPPKLSVANFYIATDDIFLYAGIILRFYQKLVKTNIIGQTNMYKQFDGIVVQGYLFTGVNFKAITYDNRAKVIRNILSIPRTLFIANEDQYDELIAAGVDVSGFRGFTQKVNGGVTLLTSAKEFFRIGDFGLIDPKSSPSVSNPQLSSILSQLIFATLEILTRVLFIYAYYHGLVSVSGGKYEMRADALIKELFGEQVLDHNDKILAYRRQNPDDQRFEPINMNQFGSDFIRFMVMGSIEDMKTLDLYEIPDAVANPDSLYVTEQMIRGTHDVYYHSGPMQVIYRVDGSHT